MDDIATYVILYAIFIVLYLWLDTDFICVLLYSFTSTFSTSYVLLKKHTKGA
jgi:hypothetical protein